MNYSTVAQEYIENGFSLFPLRTDGSKAPAVSWKPYQQRFPTQDELHQWFGNDSPCGIAAVTGNVSGNLVVFDFDHDAETMFSRWWNDAEQQLPGITAKLLVVATPRPGRQVWFRQCEPVPGNQILAYTEPKPAFNADGSSKLDADGSQILEPLVLIETRGQGGYAVAVGSHSAVHRTGRPYELIHDSFDNLPQLSAAEAELLLNICRGYSRYTPQHVQGQPGEKYNGEPRPGDIYNRRGSIPELLIKHGWQLSHTVDDVQNWTRPGKDTRDGSSATLGHVRDDDDRPLLYVYSSAAAPFQPQHSYDAFAVFATLEYRGDFSAAAAAARQMFTAEVATAQAEYHQTEQPYQPFPTRLLPPVVQTYVEEHAAAINIDAAFIGVPMLAVLAGVIGQTRKLQIKRNWTEPAVIWTATIAQVSTGKTPGWQAATEAAQRLERQLNDVRRNHQRDYEEAVREYKRQKEAGNTPSSKPEPPQFNTQLTVDDVTMETLADIHQKNWRGLLLCIDELAGWVRSFDQYRGGKGRDTENWLSIYSGRHMQVNRKTDGDRLYIPTTAVSVCGTIQPEVAADTLFSDKFVANGFAARVLAARPPAEIVRWSDREAPEHVNAVMFDLAGRLFSLTGEAYEQDRYRSIYLPFTADAQQLFRRYTEDTADHANTLDEPLRSAWAKLRPCAARFALVFSIVRQMVEHPEGQATQPVDIQSTQAGIDMAWWFGSEIARNYLLCRRNELGSLGDHLRWIREKYPGGITPRELQTGRRSARPTERARQILQELVEAGNGRLDADKFIPD